MSEEDDPWLTHVRSGRKAPCTVEILRYRGHRVLIQTEPIPSGWRAEAFVVRMDGEGASTLSAGSVTASNESQAVREAQEQARVVIDLSLEDQALRDDVP